VLHPLSLIGGLIALAVAVALGSLAIADGIRDRGKNDLLSVTGSAKRRIVSDYVVWNVSVTSQRATPQRASKELTDWAGQVREFLRTSGARDSEVTVNPITTEAVTSEGDFEGSNQVVGYRLTRSFQVRSPRVQDITDLVEASSALLNRGIPLQAEQPQYIYTKLPTLRPRLLADATRDALSRARVLVESTGADLGNLRSVNVGVFQVTSPNSTEVEDYGVYDTSTRAKDVTAVVNVTLAID
jgi:uncharacterized protein